MEEQIETINAKIASTMLGIEDHGIMTFYLHLEYGCGGQGAGGYALDSYDNDLKRRIGTGIGLEMIARVMEVVGVRKWEDLKGKHIRVKQSSNKVYAIGHLLKDDWLNFSSFFESRKD